MISAQPGQFANQKVLQDYADAHDLAYVWEGMNVFAKRWRLAQLAQPGIYELAEVRTRRGVTRALLFPKAILRAEFKADAPMREASGHRPVIDLAQIDRYEHFAIVRPLTRQAQSLDQRPGGLR